MKRALSLLLTLALLALCGCGTEAPANETPAPAEVSTPEPESAPAMELTSAGITDGVLNDKYGMRGDQQTAGVPTLSPPLTVNYIPAGTAALAITVIDPDGGDWVHWLCCFVPEGGESAELAEKASRDSTALKQGTNDFGSLGYGGPTPPSGTHRYVFTAYALAEVPALPEGFTLAELTELLETPDMVLAEATVTGTYAR